MRFVSLTAAVALLCCTLSLTVRAQPAPAAAATARRMALESRYDDLVARHTPESDPTLRSVQEQLLSATAAEEDALQAPVIAAKASTDVFYTVPIYYVTDRTGTAAAGFTGVPSAAGAVAGIATTTVGVPRAIDTSLIPNARASSVNASSVQLAPLNSPAALIAALAAANAGENGRRILLFVHGYNVSFENAMRGGARLATGLHYPVVPVVWSWPSNGNPQSYLHDEDSVRTSFKNLLDFLKQLLVQPNLKVDIVCHSMGSREVTSALAEMGRNHIAVPALRTVTYAAADISQNEFQGAWPDLQKLPSVTYSFYASDHDLPLRLSHFVHWWVPRLGDADRNIMIPAGGTTIDASTIAPMNQELGHSYILDSLTVKTDLSTWISSGTPAEARGLQPLHSGNVTYFAFRHP